MMRRGRLLVSLACLLAVGSACSAGSDDPDPTPAPPDVTLSFTQLLPDEGTNKGLLRVVNESADPLPVTEAGLRWSGYGEFLDPQDSTLAPGQTLDLHVLLPPARCEEGDEPIVGVVRTPTAEVAQPLTSSGQEFLHHLWLRGCQADLVHDNVTITYARDWSIGTAHGEPAAVGSLLLERNDGTEPVTVRSFRGSVLYGAELPAPVVARASAPTTLVPLVILPGNRCDEHARGQATAPFTFRITVDVGDTSTKVLVVPPERVQEIATEVLDRACVQRAAG
ncbi:MAG: hypothetical protein ABWZ91_12590 [Nocardioides sp.]